MGSDTIARAMFDVPRPKPFRHQLLDRLAYQLLAPVSKHLFGLGIYECDSPMSVYKDHGVWSRLKQPSSIDTLQHLLVCSGRLAQFVLGLRNLGTLRISLSL